MANETPGAPAASPAIETAPQSYATQPYTVPQGMTAEGAQSFIKELQGHESFRANLLRGNPNSREARMLDVLERHALGMGQSTGVDTVARPPEPAARPEPPADVQDYRLPPLAHLDETPEAQAQFTEARGMALEHGLTSGEFESIGDQQLRDMQRFQGLSDEQVEKQLDGELARIWRDKYDTHVGNIERYLGEHPGLREKLVGLGLGRNKMALMVLGDLAAARYGLGGEAK